MNSTTKKFTLAGLGAVCALSLSLSAGILAKNHGIANAESNGGPDASAFFYDYLLDANNNEYTLAKKFYNVLDKMNKEGDFKDGVVDYPVNEIVTSEQLKAWVENGNLEVPRAFSAARDAFLTDHPDIFYIDFYKLTISVAKSGGTYVGYINSGREANLYFDNGFNTPAAVAEAIEKYEARVNAIVGEVNKKQSSDVYNSRDAFLAKEVNRYLAENIEYSYVVYENKDDPDYVADAYVNNAYGGLVEGKAICGGYSTSYKVIMDRLGIPCITVNGYSNNKDETGKNSGSSIYHMWNYVWLANPSGGASAKTRAATSKGEWYSVDVTWNYAASNKYRYALLSSYYDEEIHVTDGVISSSGYRLRYPALSSHSYGTSGETEGLQSSIEYTPVSDGSKDDYGNPLMENFSTVSFNGKSAKTLFEEDGLYIVCRFAYYDNTKFAWTPWIALENFRQFALLGVDNPYGVIQDNGTETRFYDNTSVYYTQFAVFDVEPDIPNHVHSDSLGIYQDFYFEYTDELVEKSNAIAIGDPQVNLTYGTYVAPPYISSSKPNHQVIQVISDSMAAYNSNIMAESKAFVLEITYDEPLHILDESKPIGISFVSVHPNAQNYAYFAPLDSQGTKVEIVGESTLRFKFAPSLLYEHNSEGYHFYFTNVGSAKMVTRIVDGQEVHETSDKLPYPAYYNFERLYLACPARFNYDGRLWIDCCAQPTLVSNSDLSAMDFKDEEGNNTFTENQRSQMMLVAEKAATETVDSMLDEISADTNINVNKDEIKKSETYDISLQICGKYPTIPNGSYVKISLGFPEGYGPDDEGVTFKLFHRKQVGENSYIIEEVPCVVTKFGIVATVTSFSPYMVAVVDADKASSKTIYASIEGKGGKLTKEDGKIVSLEENQSHTYTIQPDEGYQIYSVTLNGKDVKDKITDDGKLTLAYGDVDANNELVIQYIADAAAQRVQQKIADNVIDETVEVTKFVVAVADQPVYPNSPLPSANPEIQPNGGFGATEIAITVVCVVVAAVAIASVTAIIIRKKKH